MSIGEIRYTNRTQLSQTFEGPNDFEYLNPVKLIQIFFTCESQETIGLDKDFQAFHMEKLHSLYVTEMYNQFLLYCKIFNST